MSDPQWRSHAVPAQLSFLAIYNPSLGPTDDTFRDQLVFYYSRSAHEARAKAKKAGRSEALSSVEVRAEENEQLRQIGLAQGMVDFANTFSNGQSVDAIDTEKSRIVLQELEPGWWMLASIDLTRNPGVFNRPAETKNKGKPDAEQKSTLEYSARDVSPCRLLLAQLQQAHQVFSLHHGPSLDDLFRRFSRDRFCNILDRFWGRHARHWNVLLHGNPAIDVFGGFKLASGGELGFGVGEEEWGSGEREVLEDLTRRTEGLVDMAVSRFGEPSGFNANDETSPTRDPAVPWTGRAEQPRASDGIIFGGVGATSRPSLRSISLWLRHIYAYGEHAYGVKDNPLRERRKRKRRKLPRSLVESDEEADAAPDADSTTGLEGGPKQLRQKVQQQEASKQQPSTGHPFVELMPKDERPQIHPRIASQDYAVTPEETPTPPLDSDRSRIPSPIVSAAEQALQKATDGVAKESHQAPIDGQVAQTSTTMGIPDQYMKYLTFGLSTLGKQTQQPPLPSSTASVSTGSRKVAQQAPVVKQPSNTRVTYSENAPVPQVGASAGNDEMRIMMEAQTARENKGHFLIGLRGDLDAVSENKDQNSTDDSLHSESHGSRIVLRTLHVELTRAKSGSEELNNSNSNSDLKDATEHDAVKTANSAVQRLRVVLYLRRPFIYCFLFEDRTSSLQYTDFYMTLHRALSAIHKPLLSSTSPLKIAQRIEASRHLFSEVDTASKLNTTNNLSPKSEGSSPIFNLIYDPKLLTLHTSIPNIPAPGTLAAEGLPTLDAAHGEPAWTRVDALNVHKQILDTLSSVKDIPGEIERTSKTNRGWWVVWMRMPESYITHEMEEAATDTDEADSNATLTAGPVSHGGGANTRIKTSQTRYGDMHRTAFLVRKASDSKVAPKPSVSSSRAVSGIFNAMTLGLAGRGEEDSTGGVSAGWGPGALGGGIGVDARKYIEGLLSLNR